jgi:hypothetical protein
VIRDEWFREISETHPNVERLATLIAADDLPELVRTMGRLYLSQITQLHEEIDHIDRRIAAEAKQSDIVRRLQKVPGIGPICAMAITAFAPPGGIPKWSRFCSLAWPCPATALERRQAKAWPHLEDGPTRYQKAFDYRRDVCCALEGPRRWKTGFLALEYAGPKATHAGGDCDGKQAVADRLGNALAQSRIPRSKRSGLLKVDVLIGVPAM